MINNLFLDTYVTHTDEVTRTKKYRKTPINERDNNITKIITKHVSNQKNERTCNSQFQNNNDKPLTEKAKENSIQVSDKLQGYFHLSENISKLVVSFCSQQFFFDQVSRSNVISTLTYLLWR